MSEQALDNCYGTNLCVYCHEAGLAVEGVFFSEIVVNADGDEGGWLCESCAGPDDLPPEGQPEGEGT